MTQQIQNKQLPNGWKLEKLENVGKWGSGGTPLRGTAGYYGGDIKWAIIGDLNGGILYNPKEKITEKGLNESSAKLVPKDSLLVGIYGSIGKTAITGTEMATNQAIAFIIPNEKTNLYYLKYFIENSIAELFARSHGGTQKNISQEILKSFEIPLPPLPLQSLIVSAIESNFSKIDNAIKSLKSAKNKIQLYRKAVLKKAFEKGEEIQLGKVFEIIMGQSPPSQFYNKEGRGLPFFQGKKEFNYKYPDIENWTEKYNKEADKGDLLVSIRAPIGPCNIAPEKCAIGRGIAAIKAKNETESLLLYYLIKFNEQKLDCRGTGTTFKAISKNSLNSFIVNLPSKKDWEGIVSSIESKFSVIDKVEETVNNALIKAESLKKSILKSAFEGKLVREENK